jgi:hypothetical protein
LLWPPAVEYSVATGLEGDDAGEEEKEKMGEGGAEEGGETKWMSGVY